MIKLLSFYSMILCTQLIAIIMWNQYVSITTGGSAQPILWVIWVVEVLLLIWLGFYLNKKED
ncbi:hypothetical protein [Virgibacillus doumboii]|uniref:hypothetical protein n=1 Tax=Virgibacillus doumboii TaxID=2697503 RepID=UPI0013DE8117|nr:hypothetical protein [Virgibacillus doumboii]